MGRLFVILAVILSLALPTAGAFASSMMINCKCPDSSQCSDKCDAVKCQASAGPSFVVPVFLADYSVERDASHVVMQVSFVASPLTSSLFKPPRLI